MRTKQNFPRYRPYLFAVVTFLGSASVMAGLVSGMAASVVAHVATDKVTKTIFKNQTNSSSYSEFNSLSAAIPLDITDKQVKSAAQLIVAAYKHRLGDSLSQGQQIASANFDIFKSEFSRKLSKKDKSYIKSVANLHMFCQLEAELYIASYIKDEIKSPGQVSSHSNTHTTILQKCAVRMKALPGIPADFPVGYSDVLKKIDSAEVKAVLVGVKPGDSKSTAIGLMVEGLRSIREKMGDDLAVILN